MCVCVDEDSEPLQKKLRLSTEEQEDSDTPQFSVVTLPSETRFYICITDITSKPQHQLNQTKWCSRVNSSIFLGK